VKMRFKRLKERERNQLNKKSTQDSNRNQNAQLKKGKSKFKREAMQVEMEEMEHATHRGAIWLTNPRDEW